MDDNIGGALTLLKAVGFEYAFQLPREAFDIELGGSCEIEEYLGWEIQSEPIFAAIHRRTGHAWIPQFVEFADIERVKVLIRKGFEMDLARAMEVQL